MAATLWLTSATPEPPPRPERAKAMHALAPALLALVILAIAMIVLTLMWGRLVRRRIRKPLASTHPVGDDWYGKPLTTHPAPDDRQPPTGE